MDSVIEAHDRAMAGISNGELGYIFIEHVDFLPEKDWGPHARACYGWKIYDEEMTLVGSGYEPDDYIRLGAGADPNALEAMRSLLSLLSACAEARQPASENWDLFSEAVRDFAKQRDGEILSLMIDIEA